MTQFVFDTLLRGSELALLAAGMTLVYAVVRFVNVAHLEFATLGAYCTTFTVSILGGAPFALAGALACGLVGAVSLLIYYVVVVRLLSRGAAGAMIGGFALAIVLRALVVTIWGPAPTVFDVPLEAGVDVMGAVVTPMQIRIVVIAMLALAALLLGLRMTATGRAIRAVAANRDLAEAAGIDTRRVINQAWAGSATLAALGGILIGLDGGVHPNLGFNLLLPVFAVTLLGGLGSVPGAIAAAYLLAFAEASILRIDFGALVGSASAQIGVQYQPAVAFVFVVVVLVLRPQGLFGRQVRRA